MAEGAVRTLTVLRIGAHGDGIAETEAGPVFVPFTVPGDLARVRLGAAKGEGRAATLIEVEIPGPSRTAPPCRHFGTCGGCALQHLAPAAYADLKRARVADALAQRGLAEVAVAPAVLVPAGARRRLRFSFRARPAVAGFYARSSHAIVDLAECPLAVPSLVALLAILRACAATLVDRDGRGEAAATATETGIDCVLRVPGPLDRARREALARFADTADLARLSWQAPPVGRRALAPPEPVVVRRKPMLRLGGVAVEPPPDGFVQPTAAGEAALVDHVRGALAGARRLADLHAGCGTFAFALAAGGARVAAYERDAAAVAALVAAARGAALASVTATVRDLERAPLARPELAGLDGVVLDPPRPGALAQARALASSAVPVVVYVSCNPASFARDARVLVDGGYRLEPVTPVDQFLWSPHVELVAVFRR